MLPIWSFNIMLIADYLCVWIKRKEKNWCFIAWLVKAWLMIEFLTQICQERHFRHMSEMRTDIMNFDPPVRSIHMSEPLWVPAYTLMHRQKGDPVRVYFSEQNPMFWRERQEGTRLALTHDGRLS